jgi:hypothetical protein
MENGNLQQFTLASGLDEFFFWRDRDNVVEVTLIRQRAILRTGNEGKGNMKKCKQF